MERLGTRDLAALLGGIHELAGLRAMDAFPDAAIACVRTLIPGVSYSYTAIDLRRRRTTIVADPADSVFPGAEATLLAHAGDHPLIHRFADAPDHRALAISDFLTQRAFHRLGLYAEVYRRIDTEDQLAIGLPAPPSIAIGLVINRGIEGFTGRDRLLLDLLRPHLAQAYRNAQRVTALYAAVSSRDAAPIELDAAGGIRSAPDRAWHLLGDYFGAGQHAAALPDAISRWIAAQRAQLDAGDDAPVPISPLVVARAGRRLTIRFFPGTPSESGSILLLEEQPDALSVEALVSLGLSRRQAEVLLRVTRGESNREIGAVLGISARTVQKHLEQIYAKLGVGGRTEATAFALAYRR